MYLLKPEEFVHLHTHYSAGSMLDGFCLPERTIDHIKDLGQKAIAITDHGSLTAVPRVVSAARSGDIIPIIGVEFFMCDDMDDPDSDGSDRDHLTVWAKNMEGFNNLKKLVSLGWLRGWNKRPRVDFKSLSENGDGLVIASGCALSEVSKAILEDNMAEAMAIVKRYSDRWGDDYYLELMLTDYSDQVKINKGLLQIHEATGIKMIISNDAHYVKDEDWRFHDMLLCINTKKDYDDPNRWRFDSKQYYLKGVEELQKARDEWHPYISDEVFVKACLNTLEITEKCKNLGERELEFGVFKLPQFKIDENYPGYKEWLRNRQKENNTKNFLEYLCVEGWKKRNINGIVSGDPELRKVYQERVRLELSDIDYLGYNDYFLIAWDINHWARENCIPVGYGRGSGVGSLVAYLTGITNVDPVRYKLKWERFLNRTRGKTSPPDFDLDFSRNKRELVVGRLKEKYGEDSVASICNIVTMGARTALRDVGARLKYPFDAMTKITALVDEGSLEGSLKDNPELMLVADEHPVLFQFARALEGQAKTFSVHASGKAIFPGPAVEHSPIRYDTYAKGKAQELVTMWDGSDLEKLGYLKLDILGLRTLDVIWEALVSISEMKVRKAGITIRWNGDEMVTQKGVREPVIDWKGLNRVRLQQMIDKDYFIDIDNLDWDDKRVYEEFSSGYTAMTFQMEGRAAQEVCRAVKPKNIEDLTAINSLCRPGPRDAGALEPYVNRKAGKERITYPHPAFKPVLEDTAGIILYQEQVMGIAQVLGLTASEADELRVAMKAKSFDKIAKYKETMHQGAKRLGLSDAQFEEEWNKLITFSAYGFNRSHSSAYSFIGFQTMWLKVHYPYHYVSSVLTSMIEDSDEKFRMYMQDCRRMGIKLLPPDINESGYAFDIVYDEKNNPVAIRWALAFIKGVGSKSVYEILSTRKDGPFKDYQDFYNRVNRTRVNKGTREQLIAAGVFDKFGTRAEILAIERNLNKTDKGAEIKLTRDKIITPQQLVPEKYYDMEKTLLLHNFSPTPLDAFESWRERNKGIFWNQLEQVRDGEKVVLLGQVMRVKEHKTAKGTMAFVTIYDGQEVGDLTVFFEPWAKRKAEFKPGNVILVRGTKNTFRSKGNLALSERDGYGIKVLKEMK